MNDRLDPTNGQLVHALIERHVSRLVKLQRTVLDRGDPEPLHQMRVAMRRLRSTLQQFSPLLRLPKAVSDKRLGRTVRRLGLARDLDVLQGRLVDTLIPQLPRAEAAALKPVLRALAQQRDQAQARLETVIRSRTQLEWLTALRDWLRQPRYQALAEQPAGEWIVEWQLPCLHTLMLHPGWLVLLEGRDPETMHDLRKRIKTARYRLESLSTLTGPDLSPWIAALRQGQELLGELNDLQVLRHAIHAQLGGNLAHTLPELIALLDRSSSQGWGLWRAQVALLWPLERRRQLLLKFRQHLESQTCLGLHPPPR